MALFKLLLFLTLSANAFSAFVRPSRSGGSGSNISTTALTSPQPIVRQTVTLFSDLVAVDDGTVLIFDSTTITPGSEVHTVGQHTISLGSGRSLAIDGITTNILLIPPSSAVVVPITSKPSTISISLTTSDVISTTVTGSASSGSTASLSLSLAIPKGSGNATISTGPSSTSNAQRTTLSGSQSVSVTAVISSTTDLSSTTISEGITSSDSQLTSSTTAINPITGTVTIPPVGFSTEGITSSGLTTNTWITTTKDGHSTVVPVLVGCPGCGGTFGGIILWGLTPIANVVFMFPKLPSFYLPCIMVLGISAGECSQGPTNPPDDNSKPTTRTDSSKADTSKTKSSKTESSTSETSTPSCEVTQIVTDVFVECSTGSLSGTITTNCFSTSTSVVSGCSVTATTATSFTGGFCLNKPSAATSGPIGTYSFEGYVPFSLPDITGIISETSSSATSTLSVTSETSISNSSSTQSSVISSTTLPPRIAAPDITLTTPTITPDCVQGYATYTMSAVASAPANAASLKFFIPKADAVGSSWEFDIQPGFIDPKTNVLSWKVGTLDQGPPIASGDGGKDMSIKWNTPNKANGTYVELEFTSNPPLGIQTYGVVAIGGGFACLPSECSGPPTVVTMKDGEICTLLPCSNHPQCSSGGPVTPEAACLVIEDGAFIPLWFEVTIVTNNWVTDNGEKLKSEEKGCGHLLSWKVHQIDRTSADGSWTASHEMTFTLPLTIKAGCVERAIASAGGPIGLHCLNGVSDWVF